MTIKAAFESTPGSTFNDYRNHPVTPADASKRVAEILRLWGRATQEYPLDWMMEVIRPPEGPLKQTITLTGPRETETMDLLLNLLTEEFYWRQVGKADLTPQKYMTLTTLHLKNHKFKTCSPKFPTQLRRF